MIYSLVILILKLFAFVVFVLLALMARAHFKAQGIVARLAKQGMFNYPGNGTFFFGFAPAFAKYTEEIEKNPDKTIASPLRWFLEQIENTPRQFNAKKYPMVIMN